MTLRQDLMELEKQFWTAGSDFYRNNINDECLLAFTGMAGVLSKEQVTATVKEGQRWDDLAIEEKGLLQIKDDVAVLTYRASANRPDGERYQALVSSCYVRRDGDWKLAFHQQTPLDKD